MGPFPLKQNITEGLWEGIRFMFFIADLARLKKSARFHKDSSAPLPISKYVKILPTKSSRFGLMRRFRTFLRC